VIVQFFAASAFQNFPDDLFRGLLRERTVSCVILRTIKSKADFPGFVPLVHGGFRRAVFSHFTLQRFDPDLRALFESLPVRARA
jgi:hypothetical protein